MTHLNDYRNFETVVERIKANGQHFQGTICYTLTERRLGGEVSSPCSITWTRPRSWRPWARTLSA